jgi:hypothetical protein
MLPPRGSRSASSVEVGHPAWAWLVVLAGAGWAGWHLRGSYFFYDEWSMIDRVLHTRSVDGMMASFNGHLWMLQYWIYRAQVFGFGVTDHLFVCTVFVCALVALHVSLATLLRASGLSRTSSALLGGLLTYLGVASQNFIFAIQMSPALSLAAGIAAAALALTGFDAAGHAARQPGRHAIDGRGAGALRPSTRRIWSVGLLMLLSVGLDSGTALMAVTLAGCVTLLAWRGTARLAILPAIVALGLWAALGDRGPDFPADLETRALFLGRLLLRAGGGLVGHGKTVGILVLAVFATIVFFALRRGYLDERDRIMLIAGTVTTIVIAGALTAARAGVPGMNFLEFNRYLQSVAIPMALAVTPVLAAITRAWIAGGAQTRLRPVATYLGALLVIAAFLLGIPATRSYASSFAEDNLATRHGVAQAVAVIRAGCPSGHAPDDASQPLGGLAPQISTRLLRELIDRGLLNTPPPSRPDPAIVDRMCPRLTR